MAPCHGLSQLDTQTHQSIAYSSQRAQPDATAEANAVLTSESCSHILLSRLAVTFLSVLRSVGTQLRGFCTMQLRGLSG